MPGMFKVVCTKKGAKLESKSFKDFESAFNYAEKQMYSLGCFSLVLELDFETLKWNKRCSLYPRECC